MVNHLIIVRLNNVHKNEQKTLKTYLENNCWDWNEITHETFKESTTYTSHRHFEDGAWMAT